MRPKLTCIRVIASACMAATDTGSLVFIDDVTGGLIVKWTEASYMFKQMPPNSLYDDTCDSRAMIPNMLLKQQRSF